MNYKYDKVFPFLQLFVNYFRRLRPVRVDGGIFIFFFKQIGQEIKHIVYICIHSDQSAGHYLSQPIFCRLICD